jgi:PAS domain S-box-containing protein
VSSSSAPNQAQGAEPPPTLEERASLILESVTDAFFSLDREFRFSYMNATARRLLQRSDLVGKHIWTEFPAARGTNFERAYVRAMHEGERTDFVEHYPAPLDRWYEVRAYPSPEGVSVYFQDITERRLAEDAYRRSRDQLELVVRGADVGVWYCPLPFDVLFWDDKVKEHFHLPPDAEVTIATFYERLHPEDRERTRAAIAKSIEERVPYDIDYRTVSPDGARTKWIRALGRTFYDEGGRPLRFDGVTSDVSERKRVELAMLESEERYRLATRATADVIWDWDLRTDEVLWNQSLTERFGHALGPALERASFRLEHVHPEDRGRVSDSIRQAVEGGEAEHWRAEYRFRRADGTYADVLDRGYVLRGEGGKAYRLIGAMQDLSERKRVEREREQMIDAERAARAEAERQSGLKDEFLATLSHELRTPLTAILGWSEVLQARASAAGGEIAKGLAIIVRNARSQAKIIDDLLDVGRMLAGKVRLEVRRTRLVEVVDAAVETARPPADARGVGLRVEALGGGGEATVLGDADRLQQVVWNLLTNAIKFSAPGGAVTVTLSSGGGRVTLVVSDRGEGITAEFLPFVFDRFRQADGTTTRRHGGLGLGLSIVKQVVELHGGHVAAASGGPGRGSTFTVSLPCAPRDELAPADARAAAAPALGGDLRGLRVLVLDDEPDARALVHRVLEDRGARVRVAASGAEARRHLDRERFDVLVSDIGLPGEDGYELMREVRSRPADRNGGVAAVAVTAYARAEDRVRALAAGYAAHVAKPVDAAELVAVVAAAAGRVR